MSDKHSQRPDSGPIIVNVDALINIKFNYFYISLFICKTVFGAN